MAQISPAVQRTLQFEGGYSNDPNDPGGETNYGITKRTAITFGYTGDMKTIPMTVVDSIYNEWYFIPQDLSNLNSQKLANHIFDAGVNMGLHNTSRGEHGSMWLAQAAYMEVHPNTLITEDGELGPASIEALNNDLAQGLEQDLVIAFCNLRKTEYDNRITLWPNLTEYKHSWYSRCDPNT